MGKSNQYQKTLYACYIGYVTQAIVNIFVPLLFTTFQSEFKIPLEQITLLVTINFTVQLLIDMSSMKVVDRIGYRPCMIAANLFAALGLIGLSVLPDLLPSSYIGLLCSVILYAIGGGLLEVLVSPIVEGCPFPNKASVMSMLHSYYCWGCVIVILGSTLYFNVAGIENWRILSRLWALIPIINIYLFATASIPTLVPEGKSMTLKELLYSRIIWVFFLLMMCAGAAEQSMSQWASSFAEAGLQVSKTIGDLAGPCMFALLMGLSRVLFAKIGSKVDLCLVMIGSSVLCVFSYLLAALSPNTMLALAGCALCGFSVGVLWPGALSLLSARCQRGGTAMFAMMALGGDLGCSAGPTVVGLVSSISGGLKIGLLAAVIFPVILILGLLSVRNNAIQEGQQKHDNR